MRLTDNYIEIETGSLLTVLKCPECGTIHNASVINTVCTNDTCKSTLFAQYNLSAGLDKRILQGRAATMWRYKEFLPVIDEKNIVTLGEGFTPIIPVENLKNFIGDNEVFWKDESGNPTGSFKARGISSAVSKAKDTETLPFGGT